ncbi:TIGR02452 family protein [Paenibacillus athensensis]|uniref:TIGR02452 family protein n=1 Tax=Paenibacillus athensensis TaxID=1967502 RepID=A0A4Y8PPP6_9BACL|nr:TIGR02452 family protein [Paenibacillus athensensis]
MHPQQQRGIHAAIAQDTMNRLEQGFYMNNAGISVSIADAQQRAVAGSRLYRPAELDTVRSDAIAALTNRAPQIEVTGETTLEAAYRRIVVEAAGSTACLNFASAKNPGGGFLSGSQAQEESLARSSGLYPCIAQMEEMYRYNRRLSTCLYSDYMIYSPDVPVFKNDRGEPLSVPYAVSFLTAPAVNAGVVREHQPELEARIHADMLERIRKLLAVLWQQGADSLILGAYGCGVFRNRPADVAGYFRQVLLDERFGSLFGNIVFAVYDKSPQRSTLHAFERAFGLDDDRRVHAATTP